MRDISPESPEARRKRLAKAKARFGTIRENLRKRSRTWEVIKRVAIAAPTMTNGKIDSKAR